jgi:tyrosine phenol-lyase
MPSPVEPYRAKTIAPLSTVASYEQRRQALERAGYNTYQLCEEEVFLDFAHFRGLHAMSDSQWGGMLQGDEAYAGSRNFYHIEQAVRSIFGKAWVIPVHRGRAAFNLLAQVYLSAGTSIACGPISELERYHFERSGARVLPVPVVWTSHGIAPQIELLSELLQQAMPQYFYWRLSPEPLGYPMSDLDSLLECFRLLAALGIPILWNASGCFAHIALQGKTIDFLHELASLARLLLWNAREDGFCNTGALLCGNEPQDAQHLRAVVVVFEGLHTYGGLAGRDLEALARGLSEAAHHPEIFRHHAQVRQWLQQELLHRGFHSTQLSSCWGSISLHRTSAKEPALLSLPR